MSRNNQPHTALDQLYQDLRREAIHEELAQDASKELNDLMGDEAFFDWRDENRVAWQTMTWTQIYHQVEAKISELHDLAAYMARYNVDHEPVTNLVMEVD
jgi:hypothetical protein